MKRTISVAILIALSTLSFGQVDTIFSYSEKIACTVKEINPEVVIFNYQGEDIANTMYKNAIQKIVYKSGRIQTFAESTALKNVQSVDDYENVTVTQLDYEIKGLNKLGDVGSKAKGTTLISNQQSVKERAYRKIRMAAALMGANIVYVTYQRSVGNNQGCFFDSGSSSETSLTGVAYSNKSLNLEEFKNTLSNKTSFKAVEKIELCSAFCTYDKTKSHKNFTMTSISEDNGSIMIQGRLQGEREIHSFRVVSFDKSCFTLFFSNSCATYNVKIKI